MHVHVTAYVTRLNHFGSKCGAAGTSFKRPLFVVMCVLRVTRFKLVLYFERRHLDPRTPSSRSASQITARSPPHEYSAYTSCQTEGGLRARGGDEGGINNPLILTEIQEVTSRYEGGGVIWDQRSTVSDSPSAPLFYFVAVEIIKLLQE